MKLFPALALIAFTAATPAFAQDTTAAPPADASAAPAAPAPATPPMVPPADSSASAPATPPADSGTAAPMATPPADNSAAASGSSSGAAMANAPAPAPTGAALPPCGPGVTDRCQQSSYAERNLAAQVYKGGGKDEEAMRASKGKASSRMGKHRRKAT